MPNFTSSRIVLLACLGAFASASCVEDQESLVILHSPVMEAGVCSADPESDAVRAHGLLDVVYGTSYLLPLVIQNQLVSRMAMSPNGIEEGEVHLESADVRITMDQAPHIIEGLDASLVEFNQALQTVSVAPGGREGVFVEAIPSATTRALASAIAGDPDLGSTAEVFANVDVTIHARRNGNDGYLSKISSRAFTFPIRLCTGCLFDCSTCEMQMCPASSAGLSFYVCGTAQDGPVIPVECEAGT